MLDIYFNKDYGELSTIIDNGECITFECCNKYGIIHNTFIKRKVPWLVGGKQYYDIVTPYGYGGPIIYNAADVKALVDIYEKEFSKYCLENDIVCEFIRYHPIYRNWEPFSDIYENTYSRHTVGTNLKDFDDPIQSEYSKSARKEIRKAVKNGVICSVRPCPDDLSAFRHLYEETMTRNNASEQYYFPESYFSFLTTKLKPYVLEVQAKLDGEIIGSEIYFTQGNLMHAHLLGSSEKFLSSCGGALVEATAAQWGKENGYEYIHHGGGRTSAEDDTLYLYKKKFGQNTSFDFYTGKRKWNPDIYNELVLLRRKEGPISNPEFFPQYREHS